LQIGREPTPHSFILRGLEEPSTRGAFLQLAQRRHAVELVVLGREPQHPPEHRQLPVDRRVTRPLPLQRRRVGSRILGAETHEPTPCEEHAQVREAPAASTVPRLPVVA